MSDASARSVRSRTARDSKASWNPVGSADAPSASTSASSCRNASRIPRWSSMIRSSRASSRLPSFNWSASCWMRRRTSSRLTRASSSPSGASRTASWNQAALSRSVSIASSGAPSVSACPASATPRLKADR